MLGKVKSLTFHGETTRNELLDVLREDAENLNFNDIVRCSLRIQEEAECIHTSYKKNYIKAETELVIRIRDVKNDNLQYSGHVDIEELNTAIDLLKEQEKMKEDMEEVDPAFLRIYSIISLYTTFIKEEPIHQVGTPFPGGFQVKKENNRYTCPVKKNNEDNPLAVCPFCIAE
jgi:uncharacterized protein (UPF0305 family)